jgi:hypothetical protein
MPVVTGGRGSFGGSARAQRDKSKSDSVSSGTRALTQGIKSSTSKSVNEAAHNVGSIAGPTGSMGTQGGTSTKSKSATDGTRTSANSSPQPQKNLPTGVTPLTKPKPMGATPFVEDADLLGMGARFFGGIAGAVTSALTQGLTGEDTTQSMLGEHLGKQTGWSADPSMTPGRDRAQRGTNRESFDQTNLGSATNMGRDDDAVAVPRSTGKFSDIQMADRRKPNLKQMLETML